MKIPHVHGDVTLKRFRYFQHKTVEPKLIWIWEDFNNYFWLYMYEYYPKVWRAKLRLFTLLKKYRIIKI